VKGEEPKARSGFSEKTVVSAKEWGLYEDPRQKRKKSWWHAVETIPTRKGSGESLNREKNGAS